MSNIYYQNLIQNVLDASASDNWKDAVLEWSIVDFKKAVAGFVGDGCVSRKQIQQIRWFQRLPVPTGYVQ